MIDFEGDVPKMRWLSAGVMVLAIAACSSSGVQEKPVSSGAVKDSGYSRPAAAAAASHRAAIGEFGLDLAAGRPDVHPGDDFFA
jgi:hypothetical protein